MHIAQVGRCSTNLHVLQHLVSSITTAHERHTCCAHTGGAEGTERQQADAMRRDVQILVSAACRARSAAGTPLPVPHARCPSGCPWLRDFPLTMALQGGRLLRAAEQQNGRRPEEDPGGGGVHGRNLEGRGHGHGAGPICQRLGGNQLVSRQGHAQGCYRAATALSTCVQRKSTRELSGHCRKYSHG